jgi:hypothetical protein
MIPLLVIVAWMLTTSLVAGLCVVARAGDTQQLVHASAPAGQGRVTPAPWESATGLKIAARANPRSARPEALVALHGRGVAA